MKIFLNLLPPEKKAALASQFRWRFFLSQWLFVLCLFLILLGCTGFLLMTTRQETKVQRERTKVTNGEEQKTFDEYEKKFTETNKTMKMTAGYLAFHTSFDTVLQKIESLTPEGIRMQKITTTDYKILLAGTAETREVFLLFEENIKKNGCFTNVNAPLSNLFSEKDVEFVIDFLVKAECLQGNMKVL
jgi:hypothetical protein